MFTFNFERFLRSLGVCLILVIGFEVMAVLIPEEIITDVAQQSGMKLKNDRSMGSEPLDVVILGDCFFFAGVNPVILDEMLNTRSFNFATNRVQTFMMSYVLLKQFLKNAIQTPRLIVLGVHGSSLYYPLSVDIDTLRQTVLPFFNVTPELLHELSGELKGQVIWHHMLTRVPSLRKQYLLRDNWPRKIMDFDPAKHARIEQSIKSNRGFFNEDLLGSRQEFRIDFELPAADTSIQTYNDRYIRKILSLAMDSGIKVVLVTNSYRKDFTDHVPFDINFDQTYFARLKNEFPNVIGVFNMHAVVDDPDRYVDITHLDSKGAMIFSQALAERIGRLDW